MRSLIYAFGIVAIIDMTADGDMNTTRMMFNQSVQATKNVFNWVVDTASYTVHRVEDEVVRPRPRP